MPTESTRLGLLKHTTADPYLVADYTANWNTLDASPGTFLCTSTTRPTDWGAGQTGMEVYETDTKLKFRWNGTAWERIDTKGFLGVNARLSDLLSTSTNYISVASVNVAVPQGNRRVMVVIENSGVASTVGLTQLAVFRGTTLLAEWFNRGGVGTTAANQAEPANFALTDTPVAGTHTYSLQFRTVVGYGGTSTILASANTRTAINVIEI